MGEAQWKKTPLYDLKRQKHINRKKILRQNFANICTLWIFSKLAYMLTVKVREKNVSDSESNCCPGPDCSAPPYPRPPTPTPYNSVCNNKSFPLLHFHLFLLSSCIRSSILFYFIFIFISESIYVLSILQSLTLFYIFNIEILSHTKGVCICIFESFQVFFSIKRVNVTFPFCLKYCLKYWILPRFLLM